MVFRPAWLKHEHGSLLMETMVAAVAGLVGLLALSLLFTQGMTVGYAAKARDGGVAVQRELVEAARGIPYDQLEPSTVVGRVQGKQGAGLADSSGAAGWTVKRRDVTYQLSLGVCSVDDPADGLGTHDPATFCASGPGTTSQAACSNVLRIFTQSGLSAAVTAAAASAGVTLGDCGLDLDVDGRVDGLLEAEAGICLLGSCPTPSPTDPMPDDYKRVVTLVRWDKGPGVRVALQSTLVPNPGLSTTPRVTSLTTNLAVVDDGNAITSSGTTSVGFTAATDKPASAVTWSVDGTPAGTAVGSGGSWAFTWQLGPVGVAEPAAGQVLDGAYAVSARAYDTHGSPGSPRARTVKLNRNPPYAPSSFLGGRNGTAVELEWAPGRERDVELYRVYRVPAVGSAVLVCETEDTTCRDADPPELPTVVYRAVALDRHPATGALREGALSGPADVPLVNTAPAPPTDLRLTTQDDTTTLTWTASTGDPDPGDGIDHYRIYRDGTAVADRFDRTGTAQELTFTDSRTNGLQHTYWVVAVDTHLGESTKLGPVTG